MKRVLALLAVAMFIFGGLAVCATPPLGPATNAGDGISDGSGLVPEPFGHAEAPGPAPNAGDGISDGSGF